MQETTPKRRTPLAPLQDSDFVGLSVPSHNNYTASHLTPFETRNYRRQLAKEFGLSPIPLDPFLLNQSLPCAHPDSEDGNADFGMGDPYKCILDRFSGDALDSISYSPNNSKTAAHKGRHSISNYFHGCPEISVLHTYAQNPNKAIVTIDSKTTEILTANKVCFSLLGLKEDQEQVARLSEFLISPEDSYLFTDSELKADGEVVLFSGKVMDLVTGKKNVIPVSVWARRFCSDGDYRCVVVMEPVERITGTVKFDSTGEVIECDRSFATLYGYTNSDDVSGKQMRELIPSFEYGKLCGDQNSHSTKQCVTGRTVDGFIFPLSIQVKPCSKEEIKDMKKDVLGCTVYEGVVWVFNNISGLITLLPDGTIHSCNTNFSLMLFGYPQNELVGKNISMLIPSFTDDVEFLDTDSMALPLFDDDDDSNAKNAATDGRTTADSMGQDIPRPINPLSRPLDDDYMQSTAFCSSYTDESSQSAMSDQAENFQDADLLEEPSEAASPDPMAAEDCSEDDSPPLSYSESQDTLHSCTTSIEESDVNANVVEEARIVQCPGLSSPTYEVLHPPPQYWSSLELEDMESEEKPNDSLNGADSLRLTVSESEEESFRLHEMSRRLSDCGLVPCGRSPKVSTPSGKLLSDNSLYSMPEGDFNGMGRHKDGTNLAIEYYIKRVVLDDGKVLYCLWVSRDPEDVKECSPVSKMRYSCSQSEASKSSQSKSLKSTSETSTTSDDSLAENDYTDGPFSEKYSILEHLRKGAFGCIKKSYCKSDGLLVITKFIRKSEVYEDSWVNDNKLNQKVPLEISLLITLDHPNIVKVLDVFQNDTCFQMVMEKHGSGMDLFEFIERDPRLDEPLASYIFRQIVSALSYLHSLSVLHRDIKDENVIINEKFHIKLIDFGSATFMGNELFTTFCGTMEYCSPEVIRGNKYRGPELEMFSLGVTLYTLVFGENPFIGADEILKGEYKLSSKISEDLTNLIIHLLEPDPTKRCTLPEVEIHPWVKQIVPIGRYDFGRIISATAEEMFPEKYVDVHTLDADCSHSTEDISSLEKKMDDVDLNSQVCSSGESEMNSFT